MDDSVEMSYILTDVKKKKSEIENIVRFEWDNFADCWWYFVDFKWTFI